MPETDYEYLIDCARGLVHDCPHPVANLANVSALIFSEMEDLNWAGFYIS